jgi:hypothetical protein
MASSGIQNKVLDTPGLKTIIAKVKRIGESAVTEVDDALSSESVNPVENRVVTGAVNEKQDQIPQEQLDEMTDQEIDDLIASLV